MGQPEAMEEMLTKHSNTVHPLAAELAKKRRVYIVGIGTSWHAALVAGHWFPQVRGGWPSHRGVALLRVLRLPATAGRKRRSHRHQPPWHQNVLVPGAGDGQEQWGLHHCHNVHRPRPTHRGCRRATADGGAGAVRRFHDQLHRRADDTGVAGLGTGRMDRQQRRRGAVARAAGRDPGGGGAGDGAGVGTAKSSAAIPEPGALPLRGLGPQHGLGLRGGAQDQGDQAPATARDCRSSSCCTGHSARWTRNAWSRWWRRRGLGTSGR